MTWISGTCGRGARFGVACLSVVAALLALASTPARAATPEQVEAAIRKGVDYLYSRQKSGNWEEVQARGDIGKRHDVTGGQWGGLTSIITYTLLACGEKPLDPRIVQASDWLKKNEIIGHYALGMRAQVWLYLPRTDDNKKAMLRDATLLLSGALKGTNNKGLYDYTPGPSSRIDLSCSQYGVLGMWAAADFLEEVPPQYWKDVETTWLALQDRGTGGWAYTGRPTAEKGVTPSITAAGVATLFITQEFNGATLGLDCKGNAKTPAMAAIERGLDYMAKNFKRVIDTTDREVGQRMYTMYGIERIGVASGYKYFENLDWYQAGGDFIVRTQRPDGSWGSLPDTCFALLFLARGRAPVMMNKLQYAEAAAGNAKPKEGPWNQRPRDVANITRWVGKYSERVLNWQIVNIAVAKAEDLHDAPIVYISGSDVLKLSDSDKAKLKSFVENGGMIFGNADCSKKEFSQSMAKLAVELFADMGGREMTPLPDNHVIYTGQQYVVKPGAKRVRLLHVSNGARVLMLVSDSEDLGKAWQKKDWSNPQLAEIVANIYLYAVDKATQLYKGQTYLLTLDPKVTADKTLNVARLNYGKNQNWNPEPGGWRRLAVYMNNRHRTKLNVREVDLAKDDIPADVTVAHLTGTMAFKLEPDARKRIEAFVSRGGLLVVDSAGGNGDFNTSAEGELAAIFGKDADALHNPLPTSHAVYEAGGKLESVGYRTYARGKVVGALSGPRLRGIEKNGKLAVVYSPEDLSVGLVGMPVDGIIGYSPETATALMAKILLSAPTTLSAPAAAPATAPAADAK